MEEFKDAWMGRDPFCRGRSGILIYATSVRYTYHAEWEISALWPSDICFDGIKRGRKHRVHGVLLGGASELRDRDAAIEEVLLPKYRQI